MSAPGFIFSTDGKSAPTYDQIQRRRKVLDALLAQQGQRAPQNVGEGLHALGQGIVNGLEGRALRKAEEESAAGSQKAWSALANLGPGSAGSFGAGAGYGSATGPISDASPTPSGSMVAASDLAPYQAALLDTISGPESAGAYDVIYGGSKFADFSDHPRKAVPITSGPNVGQTSSAAGRYQFLGSTWDQYRNKLGLQDFSPANQDKAAYALAADTYRQKTGQDLDAVLQSGDPDAIAGVGSALSGVWTSLPGGIEQGTNTNRFVSAFSNSLGRYGSRNASPDTGSASVQVASLDPSAGVAEATRAGASVSTAPTVGGQQPVPANVPVPTARQALEKAFAVQAEKEGMSGIAPLGMPGSTPQTEEAIQRYAAANGTTPMQYQGGQPGVDTAAAPGSIADQRADAIIAGDPERPIVAPVPTPRPEMAQAGGIPPQAVAASAMARQPAPFDPVNGTAMGGNTGAADAAKAAYLEANGRSPAVQRVAEAMNQRGAPVAPAASVPPAVQQVAQAYGQRQAQDQAQGRFEQLMGIAMNPAVEPGARQYAMQVLEADQQFRSQQQNRAYETWKTRQQWGREDARNAVTDRREDRRLQLEIDKDAREASQPIEVGGVLVDRRTMQPVYQPPAQPFTLQPGETRFGGDGNKIAEGGAKPGYRNLTPAEVSQLGLAPGAYQAGPDGKIEGVGKSGITINTGENGSEFVKEGEKSANTRLGEIITAGQSAAGIMGDVQQLADLGRQIGTGKIAQVKAALGPYAQALGIDIANQGEAEAYQSIIARMAPQMRPAGSGATSDFDARQFLAALPSLGNSPEGNQIITDTFTAVSQNKLQAAELASLAYLPKEQGGIPWQEAEKRIRALPNPYQQFREMQRQQSRQGVANSPASQPTAPNATMPNGQRYEGGVPVGGASQPAAVPQRATNPQTGQVIELRNGQWVPVQ